MRPFNDGRTASLKFNIQQIKPGQLSMMHALLDVFGEAFEEIETFGANRPSGEYLESLLASETFIALVALVDGEVAGGLAAYELRKFEQARSEIYIYDLAVAAAHRRKGIATALIAELQKLGRARGAYVIFVQADPPDKPAVALYSRLGVREDVFHFDIAISGSPDSR